MSEHFKPLRNWHYKQWSVITLLDGEYLVLAPPGCGKTDILTERIRYALFNGIKAGNMICLTFTNRASREMRKRIKKNIGENTNIFIGNLHKYCSEFLFKNNYVDAGSTVLDELDLQDILREFMTDEYLEEVLNVYNTFKDNYSVDWDRLHRDFLLEENWPVPDNTSRTIKRKRLTALFNDCRMQIANFLNHIHQIENNHPLETRIYDGFRDWGADKDLLTVFNHTENLDENNPIHKIIICAKQLQDYKKDRNLLTFDDLILQTYTIYASSNPDTDQKIKHYSWIQVDEVQDLNPLQIALVDKLKSTDTQSVVYLGDEQQAIFSFMGAKIETLELLKEKCYKTLRLEKNFRSPKFLVELFNKYAIDILQTPSDLLPIADNDIEADLTDKMIFGFLKNEVDGIVRRALPFYMKLAKQDEESDPEHKSYKTAIIVPTNALADQICDELNHQEIPHFKISGTDIFSSDAIKTVIAHLTVINNDINYMAWARLLWQQMPNMSFKEARDVMKQMIDCAVLPNDLILNPRQPYIMRFINSYLNDTIVVFDTETTGLDIFNDDIVQIAAIKIKHRKIIDKFDVVLHTDRKIPEFLGDDPNPLIDKYASSNHEDRAIGLKRFMSFCKGCTLVAHNANYDYNILNFNLRRDCGTYSLPIDHKEYFDTLKIAKMLYPKLRYYKLKFLGEVLNLEGANTHLADDDTYLTVNLLYKMVGECMSRQNNYRIFIQDNWDLLRTFADKYGPLYKHSLEQLYNSNPQTDGYDNILAYEMAYAFETLNYQLEDSDLKKVNKIFNFIDKDVIEEGSGKSLIEQLTSYLPVLSTFKEADLCESSTLNENIFVSTIHKAKGLEFQNVIVASAIKGFYPFFNSRTNAKKREDARKLYVAISRAKKRLCITYQRYNDWGGLQTLTPFLDTIIHQFKKYQE